MFSRLTKFRSFLGKEVWTFFIKSCLVGVAWFGIESAFIFVLEGFLKSLGILNERSSNLAQWYPSSVAGASLVLIVFGVIRASIFVAKDYLSNITQTVFVRHQRSLIVEYALTHGEEVSSFQVLSLFNETLSRAASVVQQSTQLIISITCSVLFLALGMRLAPFELLSGIALLALFLYPLKILNKKIDLAGKEIDGEWGKINETLVVSLKNYNLLKIYHMLGQSIDQIKNSLFAYQKHFKNFQIISSSKSAFPLLIGTTIISFVTYMSQKYFHTNGIVLLSFFYIFIRLSQAASEMSVSFSNLRLNLPSFKHLYHWSENAKLTRSLPESGDPRVEAELQQSVGRTGIQIEVDSLAFGYDPTKLLFRGITFKLVKGDCLVIQGASGRGKSTLLTLLLGLNHPTEGTVRVNGFPVKEVANAIAAFVAYVGPEPFLIKGTIRDNLLYCHPSANEVTEEQCWAALEKAQLKDLVLKIGLREELNEMTPISTGQKQRLAIARAILRSPSLLILDEATANLDHETEEKFIASLREVIKTMTVVIITHKPTLDQLSTQSLKL